MLHFVVLTVTPKHKVDAPIFLISTGLNESLDSMGKYILDVVDPILVDSKKYYDSIDPESRKYNIDDPGYERYAMAHTFYGPYIKLRNKIKNKVPLTVSDLENASNSIFAPNTLNMELSIIHYDINQYQDLEDYVYMTLNRLGYRDEDVPEIKDAQNTKELFSIMLKYEGEYNSKSEIK